MPRTHAIFAAVPFSLAAIAPGGPPVEVVMKTGDVINERPVLSFDMSDIMGQQWAYAPLGDSGLWAGAIQQGPGDPEPVRAFALLSGSEDGSVVPAMIYQAALDPDTSLVSFVPRHFSGNAVHYAQAYTIAEGESFARSATFLAQVGETTRVITPDTFKGFHPDTPLRTRFSRVTPDAGFFVGWFAPGEAYLSIPFAVGDPGTTLVLDDDDLLNNRDAMHAFYNPGQGLIYAEQQRSLYQLAPPFDPDLDHTTLLEESGVVPSLFGGSIGFFGVGHDASLSNHDAFVTFSDDNVAENVFLGTFSAGFEAFYFTDLEKADEDINANRAAIEAHAPHGSAVITANVLADNRVFTRSWLFRPAFGPAELITLDAPIPGLDPDLIVEHVNWYKVSDRGAVLAALRLAPMGEVSDAFTAIVARHPTGLYEIIAREGQPIPGDAAGLGAVESIDTAVPGAPSEQTLTIDGRGLFAATFDSGEQAILSVTLGRGGCAPADLFPDDALDITDILAFLTAFDANDPLANFNGDHDIDFDDVLAFLEAYANGCP